MVASNANFCYSETVNIVKMFVKNPLCDYRESKKSDKYVVELATRAQDPNIRKLAVETLNEYHVKVRAAPRRSRQSRAFEIVKEGTASPGKATRSTR
jgi:hypothetical protein